MNKILPTKTKNMFAVSYISQLVFSDTEIYLKSVNAIGCHYENGTVVHRIDSVLKGHETS